MILPPDLRDTLVRVAGAMAYARDPWWIIGSAAVVLHGAATSVADVDLMTSARDARAFLDRTGGVLIDAPHDHFRSSPFGRWPAPPLAVEVMGDLRLHEEGGWRHVELASREAVPVGNMQLFVPARGELIALLHRFGREKDLARAMLLGG